MDASAQKSDLPRFTTWWHYWLVCAKVFTTYFPLYKCFILLLCYRIVIVLYS